MVELEHEPHEFVAKPRQRRGAETQSVEADLANERS